MGTLLIGLDESALTAEQTSRLRELAGGRTVVVTEDEATIDAAMPDVEIATGRLGREFISGAPNLRWFHQWSAGAEWTQARLDTAEDSFVLTNASGLHGIPISEQVFAYLLAFARDLPRAIRDQADHVWHRPEPTTDLFELAGKTMLVVGTGAIGDRIAELARAFQMSVVGVRRTPDGNHSPHYERIVGADGLHDELPHADFVVVTLPGTRETSHMFGATEFGRMKPSAYFVNIGRGSTVDESALVDALQTDGIAGAGLDVFETEPLPEDSPLWDMPNVIVTCHYAGTTPEYDRRGMDIFLENLARYVRDEPLRNVVDRELGY